MVDENRSSTSPRGPFLPIFLFGGALLVLLVFQTVLVYWDRDSLVQLEANQQQPLAEAQRVRQQLDGIAADTARLAENGNGNANRVVEELRKRGITITPAKTASSPAQSK